MDNKFYEQTFEEMDWADHDFSAAEFENCVFKKCNFSGADLNHAFITECRFEACDFSNVQLKTAKLIETTFVGCKLIGVRWIDTLDLRNPVFENCNLSMGNFNSLKLKKIKIVQSRVHDVDFSSCDLTEGDFQENDFLDTRFHNTILLKADFSRSINYQINPLNNKITGAKFSLPDAVGLLSGLGVVITD